MNTIRPTLALCVPAYKAEAFLPRLLESAQKQSPAFDEIIVCVDASPDATADVAKAFGATVIINENNLGCSASKNRALEAASSDWIHFHDADDELLPNFTTLAHQWVSRSDVPDVVLFDYEYLENETRALIARSDFDDEALKKDPVRYAILTQINPFCGLYRRLRLMELGGYDTAPDILYNEDVAFHCKLALAGFTFRAEKELSIINYRMKGSMSGSNQIKCLKAHHAVMKRMINAVGNKYPAEIASELWKTATGLAAHLAWAEVDAALEDAHEIYPKIPRNQSPAFTLLCKTTGSKLAFRIREYGIRIFKGHLRSKMSQSV